MILKLPNIFQSSDKVTLLARRKKSANKKSAQSKAPKSGVKPQTKPATQAPQSKTGSKQVDSKIKQGYLAHGGRQFNQGVVNTVKGLGTLTKGVGQTALGLTRGAGTAAWSLTKGIGKGLYHGGQAASKGAKKLKQKYNEYRLERARRLVAEHDKQAQTNASVQPISRETILSFIQAHAFGKSEYIAHPLSKAELSARAIKGWNTRYHLYGSSGMKKV